MSITTKTAIAALIATMNILPMTAEYRDTCNRAIDYYNTIQSDSVKEETTHLYILTKKKVTLSNGVVVDKNTYMHVLKENKKTWTVQWYNGKTKINKKAATDPFEVSGKKEADILMKRTAGIITAY